MSDLLLVANNFPPIIGGSSTVYSNLCRHLADRVVVIAPKRSYVTEEALHGWEAVDAALPFPVRRADLLRPVRASHPMSTLAAAGRYLTHDLRVEHSVARCVSRAISELRPKAVCFGELYPFQQLGRHLQRNANARVIYYIHGEEITSGSGSRRMESGAMQSLQHADGVIAVSSFTRKELIQRGVTAERICVLTNGVESDRFLPGPKDESLSARYQLQGKQVLLTVGRLEPRKGHDRVIEALPKLLERWPNLVYAVVGGGDDSRLRALARETGTSGNIIFAGAVSAADLPRWYRTCDLFVMPNRRMPNGDTEGFGIVFLEANASGKPVIGGTDGGVPDAVAHGQTGLLVNGDSAGEVAATIHLLLADPLLRSRLAKDGLVRSRSESWITKSQQFLNFCLHEPTTTSLRVSRP